MFILSYLVIIFGIYHNRKNI